MTRSQHCFLVTFVAFCTISLADLAEAKCTNVGRSPFSPATNDTVSRSLACDSKGGKVSFSPGAGYVFTATTVSRASSNSTVRPFSHGYTYTPKAGFVGQDSFSMRVCGSRDGQSGCSTLNYNVVVN
jgi:hypothetical protein